MVTDVNSIEELIRSGAMKITGRLAVASNATMLAMIDDGADGIEVVYKPIAGERPLWDFSHGSLANREFATYLLSSTSGFDVVPFTTLRDGPFGPGAVQQWIEVNDEIDPIAFFQSDHLDLRKMALFDAIINNTDRKIGHILPSKDGLVLGCDHGVTFHEEDKLRTVLWQWAGEALAASELALLQKVEHLLRSTFRKDLELLLTKEEISALEMRVKRLSDLGVFPHPSSDWPAVPWPPF